LWKWEKRDVKWTKPPYQPSGKLAKSDNAATWSSFEKALKAYQGGEWDGIGFMLTPPYVGVDLDSCINPKTKEPQDWARATLSQFKSYSEISPSECGYKILLKGKLDKGHHAAKIGVFQSTRYFCLTGHVVNGFGKIEERQKELDALIKREWPEDLEETGPLFTPDKTPSPELTIADIDIYEKAGNAQNGEKFLSLWEGSNEGYPSASEGDAAFCSMLAFWTQDPAQIDRLFRTSKRMRDKWDRADYQDRTIKKALSNLKETYNPPQRSRAVTGEVDALLKELEVFDHERLYRELGISSSKEKSVIRTKLSRMLAEGIIRKSKSRPGWFEVVNKDLQPMDLSQREIETLPVKLPLGIDELVKFHPGNIILVAGDVEVGKTGFLLNVAKANLERFKVHYFNSEMGEEEFTERLNLFNDWPWGHGSFFAYERSSDFHSVMQRGRDNLNIIDFLELTENFYMISSYLNEIHRVLNGAIAVVGVQKQNPYTELPLGGYRGLEKPRLAVALSSGKIKILKAKNWKNPKVNPKGLSRTFKLVSGCHFIGSTGWAREEDTDGNG
jgi:hypothetical protein